MFDFRFSKHLENQSKTQAGKHFRCFRPNLGPGLGYVPTSYIVGWYGRFSLALSSLQADGYHIDSIYFHRLILSRTPFFFAEGMSMLFFIFVFDSHRWLLMSDG